MSVSSVTASPMPSSLSEGDLAEVLGAFNDVTAKLHSAHESLRAEAHDRRTSMNKLCISKLLQVIDEELVPAEMMVAEEPAA